MKIRAKYPDSEDFLLEYEQSDRPADGKPVEIQQIEAAWFGGKGYCKNIIIENMMLSVLDVEFPDDLDYYFDDNRHTVNMHFVVQGNVWGRELDTGNEYHFQSNEHALLNRAERKGYIVYVTAPVTTTDASTLNMTFPGHYRFNYDASTNPATTSWIRMEPSGLEKILATNAERTMNGWRLISNDPNHYNNIGQNSVDFQVFLKMRMT